MTDTHAATELKLYIDNDGDLYRRQTTSILKNLVAKRARGQYKHDLAVKAFGYLVESGAKKYAKEFGSPDQPWHKMFDAGTRKRVAEELTRDFEGEAKLGNYDQLLPKKYQTKDKTAHARKKLSFRAPAEIEVAWSPVNQAYFALWPANRPRADQQVLKVASAEEMRSWLRDTYGDPRGSSRAHSRRKNAAHDRMHAPGALRSATDRQLRGFYREEKRDAARARAEASRRGLSLHARNKKSHAQLDREIADVVPSWRGGR